MKKNNFKFIFILISCLIIIGCTDKTKQEEIIRPVKVLDLASNRNLNKISFSAIAIPYKETVLGFKIAGPIEKLDIEAGELIKKDQLIGTMDSRDYLINLEANKKQYEGAKAAAENMEKQYKRAKILYEGKAMAQKNFDIITAQYKGSQATLKKAEQGVKDAQNRLKDTKLTAPYDAYIGKKLVDRGSVVGAGTPVVTLVSMSTPKIVINVAGKDIDKLNQANDYIFKNKEKEYKLKLIEIGKNPDTLKLTYPVTFEFLEKENDIRIGETGEVVATLNSLEQQEIFIPITALFEDEGTKVYIYDNGVVKAKAVEIGKLHSDGYVDIKKGLDLTDKVITAGVNTISDGDRVKILTEPSNTNIGGVL